jgi:hypothetical protein
MAYERVTQSALPQAISDVVADLADLFQKEMRLARAELSAKLNTKLMAGAWFSAAGFLALVAALLVVQAIVFAIASFGLAMHWSCLIVAVVLAALAAAFFFKGRENAKEEITPTRTINQIQRDISTVKERLT